MSALLRRASAFAAGCICLAVSWGRSGRALAAPCGRADVDLTFPPKGAQHVPQNAGLSAHYAAPALYAGEPVTVTDGTGNAVSVTVSYDEAEALLLASPDQPLTQQDYTVVWPGLRGVSGGGVGQGRTVHFSVSNESDASAPTFAGLSAIAWDLSRDRDPCLDGLEDRFVFRLRVSDASDDSPVSLLRLNVFQTRDPLASEPTQPSLVAFDAWPESGEIEVRRPATKAGHTCFAALTQDLLGHPSGGGEREVCVKTQLPPFFDGCAFAPGASARSPLPRVAPWLAALGLALLRRRRSATRPA